MSGPVSSADTPVVPIAPVRAAGLAGATRTAPPGIPGVGVPGVGVPGVEVTESRVATVGALPVRRALPQRTRRTVGAWCFADHMGPAAVTEDNGVEIGPHPHVGLHTVTWLVAGELLHRDSLGSEQVIRAGQLNLMTAGNGVVHSEESTSSYQGQLHGIQLWVAQPESTRHGTAAFEHHSELPRVEHGDATATVIVGEFGGARSPARHDTPMVGTELSSRRGTSTWPLRPDFEYAVIVFDGVLDILGSGVPPVVPGRLAYLGLGRDEISFTAAEPTRLLLLGGEPFGEAVLMFWNFVTRTRGEVDAAYEQWVNQDDRFAPVASALPRIPSPPPPWHRPR